MTDRESVKRPRLGEQIAPQYQPLPFSQYLSKSLHNQKHPILSDKKLIVYDLKIDGSTLEQEQDYRQLSWKRLQRAIHAIQTEQPCPESLEVLYQLCEDLCQYGHTRELYEHLHAECNQYVHVQFESFSHQPEDIDYLAHIHSAWKKYCDQMSQIRCLFLYLDRTYVASTTKTGTIWNMAMDLFREHFMMYDDVWKKTLAGILELIRLERSGQSIDESFLQSNIRMLMDLQLYHTSFEQQLLIQTKAFYEQEGDQLLSHMDVFDYLEHVSTRVHQESILRVKNYFDKSIKSSLQSIVERELLTKRIEVILTQCFSYFQSLHLFQDSDYDKFSLLYRLLHKINHLDICAKYFTNYIKKKGSSIMCSKTSAKEKVMMLSQFESQADEIVDHSFEGDEQFVDGLKDGIDYFVNLRDNNAVKILAKHTDQILRSTSYDDSLLEKGMFLFRYLQAKDTFELVYKRDLAKRLLLNKTTKSGEKAMLTKMKKICGAGYTGKMEGMVKDIEKSTELMHEFKQHYRSPLNMHVNLLTYGFWPTYVPINIRLPSPFEQAQAIYCQFYASKFEKRILTWYHSLGVCEVKASYPRGTKHITLTLLQATVLLLFDRGEQLLSFNSILSYTQLDELELRKVLVSLCCREYKLLVKYSEGGGSDDIKPTDQFALNHDFYTEKDKISITTATLSEVIEKDASLDTTILFAREQQIDAIIVRIMKHHQTLGHGQLLNEVTCKIKFPIIAQEIKKRIEKLIEKEYLKRGPEDTYVYLA